MKNIFFIPVIFILMHSEISYSQYTGGSYDGYYSILDTNIPSPIFINNNVSAAEDFRLYQNYPNPFNPETIIQYDLRNANYVVIKIYDVSGKEIAALVEQNQNAGSYSVVFDGRNYASGVYFYKIVINPGRQSSGQFSETKKMLLTK